MLLEQDKVFKPASTLNEFIAFENGVGMQYAFDGAIKKDHAVDITKYPHWFGFKFERLDRYEMNKPKVFICNNCDKAYSFQTFHSNNIIHIMRFHEQFHKQEEDEHCMFIENNGVRCTEEKVTHTNNYAKNYCLSHQEEYIAFDYHHTKSIPEFAYDGSALEKLYSDEIIEKSLNEISQRLEFQYNYQMPIDHKHVKWEIKILKSLTRAMAKKMKVPTNEFGILWASHRYHMSNDKISPSAFLNAQQKCKKCDLSFQLKFG